VSSHNDSTARRIEPNARHGVEQGEAAPADNGPDGGIVGGLGATSVEGCGSGALLLVALSISERA
jgi:hypothetical protein